MCGVCQRLLLIVGDCRGRPQMESFIASVDRRRTDSVVFVVAVGADRRDCYLGCCFLVSRVDFIVVGGVVAVVDRWLGWLRCCIAITRQGTIRGQMEMVDENSCFVRLCAQVFCFAVVCR